MKTLAIVMLLTLSGCFYQQINTTEIKKAEQYCKDKLGILWINEHFIGLTKIACVSGDITRDHDITLVLGGVDD